MGFVIGDASGDGRPKIARQSADFLKIFLSRYRPKVARSSGVNRPTIVRRSVDDISSKNCLQIYAGYQPSFGRWSPDCRPIINFSLCSIVYNACVHINYELCFAFILFWDSFHLTSCTSNIWLFCVGIPNEQLFVWHFDINISPCTTSRRFQANSGHTLIYDDCNLILHILQYKWIELSIWSFEKISTSSNFKSTSKHSLIYCRTSRTPSS